MTMSDHPKLVVTIHGIRTRGLWQKQLTPFLAKEGLIPYHIDYGFFSALAFLLPPLRERRIRIVRDEIRRLVNTVGGARVNIVAHSFGTYLAMECLRRENGNIKFGRVVLTGSILPTNFDWSAYEANRRILAVRNERATEDSVVFLARLASARPFRWFTGLNAGNSGRVAFSSPGSLVIDDEIEGGHSEVHNELKFECWSRFLSYPKLPQASKARVLTEMQRIRQHAARFLEVDVSCVRVNFFAPQGSALKIVPGLAVNMKYVPEYEIEIQPDHGATGKAFVSGDPHVVIKSGTSWSGNDLPADELEKVHPDLRWIISLPVRADSPDRPLGVINVDGLCSIPPKLVDPESTECQAVSVALWQAFAKPIHALMARAYCGNQLAGALE